MSAPAAIILAAGRGTRMKSKTPKVLHRLAGKPMIRYALDAVREAGLAPVVLVVGHGADAIRKEVGDQLICAEQTEQLGTGHAVLQGLPYVGDAAEVVVLYGDNPLVQAKTLRRLVETRRATEAPIVLLAAVVDDPSAYGRIVRDVEGRVVGIVEVAGASPEVLQTREINGGLYCFDTGWLHGHLSGLPLRPKGEYYLTDLAAMASAEGLPVETIDGEAAEIAGVNDRVDLAKAERMICSRIRQQLMLSGVTLVDPATAYVDADAQVGADTVIWPNTIVAGKTVIGESCEIGPNSHIVDSRVGDGCRIWASVIEASVLETGVTVGPLSHLRPGTRLEAGVHVGNFAEIKNSHVDSGTKMHHFSYVGDATVGRNVNVGAGTVTCNYDSETRQKHRTIVEDGAALGSDTMLVAPVWIGSGAMTGAGSVVTKDVPPDSVAVGVPARVVRKVKKST